MPSQKRGHGLRVGDMALHAERKSFDAHQRQIGVHRRERWTKIAQRDGRLVEMYLFAAIVYFALSYGMSRCVKALQARVAIMR